MPRHARYVPAVLSFVTSVLFLDNGDADDEYLTVLRRGGASLPPAPYTTSLPPRGPVDAHSVNMSVYHRSDITGQDAQYLSGALRAFRKTQESAVRRVASLTDAANLGEEVAVVGIGRGCDPFVSEALFSSMEAAAAADTLGLKWYFVSNGEWRNRHSPLITLLSALTAWGNGIFMP